MQHPPSSVPRGHSHWFEPVPGDDRDPVVAWQRRVDLGQIGKRTLADPEIVARRERTEALFAGRARRAQAEAL